MGSGDLRAYKLPSDSQCFGTESVTTKYGCKLGKAMTSALSSQGSPLAFRTICKIVCCDANPSRDRSSCEASVGAESVPWPRWPAFWVK